MADPIYTSTESTVDALLSQAERPLHRHYCGTCRNPLAIHWAHPPSGRPWRWYWAVCRACARSGEACDNEVKAVAAFNEVTP